LSLPRNLSNPHTKWYKIGPVLGVALFLFMMTFGKMLFEVPHPPTPVDPRFDAIFKGPIGMLVTLVAIAIWSSMLYYAWKLKSVALDGTTLQLKGLREEVAVPLHQVRGVEQPWWSQQFARIEFHGETSFGDSIWFIPIGGRRGLMEPSGTVTELRALVAHSIGDRSFPPPAPLTDYTGEWRTLRRLRAISFLGTVGFFGTAFYAAIAHPGSFAYPLLAFIPGVVGMVAGMRADRWLCPRCREPFFASRWRRFLPSFFTRSCGNCGLPRGAKGPPLPMPDGE
jgi:hypothetical protein